MTTAPVPEPGDTIPVSGDLTITEVTQRHYLGTVNGHAALWPRATASTHTPDPRAVERAEAILADPSSTVEQRRAAREILR